MDNYVVVFKVRLIKSGGWNKYIVDMWGTEEFESVLSDKVSEAGKFTLETIQFRLGDIYEQYSPKWIEISCLEE